MKNRLIVLVIWTSFFGCQKSEVRSKRINFLCESSNQDSFKHQFGLTVNDTIYCFKYIEIHPVLDEEGELNIYYLLSLSSSKGNNYDGSISFRTQGFSRKGLCKLKILSLHVYNDIQYDNYNEGHVNGKLRVDKFKGDLVTGEFEADIPVNDELVHIYGNFKDIPVENR